MGGHMQPQGHLQLVVNMIDCGLDPQAAIDAPRWHWVEGLRVKLEPQTDPALADALRKRGHDIEIDPDIDVFGNGQVIRRDPAGVFIAGSDGRTDGFATGF